MRPAPITIVSPLFRTGAYVEELVNRVDAVMRSRREPWNLLFVDDACPSGSGRIAARLGHPSVEVAMLAANVGQQAATTYGVIAAEGGTIVIMDSDLQDRPEDVPLLLGGVEPGVIVAAGRRGDYTGVAERTTGTAFRLARWALSRGRVPRDAGMFVCGEAATLGSVARSGDPRAHLLSRAARLDVPVTSIPIERVPRRDGGSYSSAQRVAMGSRALWTLVSSAAPRRFDWPEVEWLGHDAARRTAKPREMEA